MCFANYEPFCFISVVAGFQEKCNTMPDYDGNYHWWVRDTKTGKIIDPSPGYNGTCEDWDTGRRYYFKYSPELKEKKYNQLLSNMIECSGGYPKFIKRCELIGTLGLYKRGKCFMNALGYIMANDDDSLVLEGGACGYEIDNFNHCRPFPEIKRNMKIINLDWGY